MGELHQTLENVEEEMRVRFEDMITKKISELANILGNNAKN